MLCGHLAFGVALSVVTDDEATLSSLSGTPAYIKNISGT